MLPYVLYDYAQYVGAYMRMRGENDIFRSAEFDKAAQNICAARVLVFYKRSQLSVRKSAGAAFAELYIAFGIEFAGCKKAFGLTRTRI